VNAHKYRTQGGPERSQIVWLIYIISAHDRCVLFEIHLSTSIILSIMQN